MDGVVRRRRDAGWRPSGPQPAAPSPGAVDRRRPAIGRTGRASTPSAQDLIHGAVAVLKDYSLDNAVLVLFARAGRGARRDHVPVLTVHGADPRHRARQETGLGRAGAGARLAARADARRRFDGAWPAAARRTHSGSHPDVAPPVAEGRDRPRQAPARTRRRRAPRPDARHPGARPARPTLEGRPAEPAEEAEEDDGHRGLRSRHLRRSRSRSTSIAPRRSARSTRTTDEDDELPIAASSRPAAIRPEKRAAAGAGRVAGRGRGGVGLRSNLDVRAGDRSTRSRRPILLNRPPPRLNRRSPSRTGLRQGEPAFARSNRVGRPGSSRLCRTDTGRARARTDSQGPVLDRGSDRTGRKPHEDRARTDLERRARFQFADRRSGRPGRGSHPSRSRCRQTTRGTRSTIETSDSLEITAEPIDLNAFVEELEGVVSTFARPAPARAIQLAEIKPIANGSSHRSGQRNRTSRSRLATRYAWPKLEGLPAGVDWEIDQAGRPGLRDAGRFHGRLRTVCGAEPQALRERAGHACPAGPAGPARPSRP